MTKMPDENLNEKNRTQKYSGKIGLSLDDVGKYSVTHKDITNILAGDSQSFLKRSLWEFILDLFPMSHIKEAKPPMNTVKNRSFFMFRYRAFTLVFCFLFHFLCG